MKRVPSFRFETRMGHSFLLNASDIEFIINNISYICIICFVLWVII